MIVLLLVVGAGVAALVLGSPAAGRTRAPDASTHAAGELARWASQQLPPGARLLADRKLAGRLRAVGVPLEPNGTTSTARASRDGGASPGTTVGGHALLVTDGGVPSGARLVARFGSPAALAVVDPAPVAPTAAELQRRRDLAAALLGNPTTRAAAPVARVLRAAAVDQRLLTVLAALAARSGVAIAALPAAPGEPADVPLARSAVVEELGGHRLAAGSPDTEALIGYLRAQQPPYLPDEITVTSRGVLIGYRYLPGPDAAVTAAAG